LTHQSRFQEYQENESGLVVENGERSQTVNLFGCKNSSIQIKGKVNAITLGEPMKTSSYDLSD